MVLLWGFRPAIDASGIFGHGFISDGTVSMLVGVLLFFIPNKSPSTLPIPIIRVVPLVHRR
jgi:hypothetical protein